MKKAILMTAFALSVLGFESTSHAIVLATNATIGDLILGVTDTEDGFTKDLLIDLGKNSTIDSSYFTPVSINADLTQVFGSNYSTLANLSYGVIAFNSNNVFMSQATTADDGYPSTDGTAGQSPLNQETTYAPVEVSVSGIILEMQEAYKGLQANAGQTANGVYVLSSDTYSWNTQEVGGFGISAWGSSADAPVGTALDMYNYVQASSSTAGTYQGYQLNLSEAGIISTSIEDVPEPCASALFALGALLIVGVVRHRKTSAKV